MNPGPYNEKLRQFAAAHLQGLNIRVQEHGRVELTPTMAFVEAMVAVPLDVNGEPWYTELSVIEPPKAALVRAKLTTKKRRKK